MNKHGGQDAVKAKCFVSNLRLFSAGSSQVSHQAVLSVDETGTEAAAATTIEIMPMSLPEVIELNRPFMVFILEHSTRSFVFMGKIVNPTA